MPVIVTDSEGKIKGTLDLDTGKLSPLQLEHEWLKEQGLEYHSSSSEDWIYTNGIYTGEYYSFDDRLMPDSVDNAFLYEEALET